MSKGRTRMSQKTEFAPPLPLSEPTAGWMVPTHLGEEDFLARSTDSYVISSGSNLTDTSTHHFLPTFWQSSWHIKLTIIPVNICIPYMAQGGLPWWLRGKEFACNSEDAGDMKQFQSLGQEDPLDEGIATHSSILAWRTPWTEEPGGWGYSP